MNAVRDVDQHVHCSLAVQVDHLEIVLCHSHTYDLWSLCCCTKIVEHQQDIKVNIKWPIVANTLLAPPINNYYIQHCPLFDNRSYQD